MKIYQLEHTVLYKTVPFSNQKGIGIYLDKSVAEERAKVFSQKEGFKEQPNGFHINEFELDKIYHEDGFLI